jgi:amidophosphoribosyltransferase
MTGILGVFSYDNKNIINTTNVGLRFLQTRGQESVGISVGDYDSIRTYKAEGEVTEVFNKDILKILNSSSVYSSIAHLRSFEVKDRNKIEPVELERDNFRISVAMDGRFFDQDKFGEYGIGSEESTELFSKVFLKYLTETEKTDEAAKRSMKDLDNGYFSVALLVNDGEKTREVGIRDKTGLKPYCLGKIGNTYVLSSESVAFTGSLRGELVRDVRPGEFIEFDPNNPEFISKQLLKPTPKYCSFEWNYFANRPSIIQRISVDHFRKEMGRKIFERYKHLINIDGKVVPVPESGKGVSLGFAEASGLLYDESIIKNPYAKRTFIIPDEQLRLFETSVKYSIVEGAVEGQILYVGDDSIVRGTEANYLTTSLKKIGGAREVHYVIGTPPCIATCQDVLLEEGPRSFIASKFRGMTIEEIGRHVAREIGADSVLYPTLDMEIETLGIPRENLCLACLDGRYPVEITS